MVAAVVLWLEHALEREIEREREGEGEREKP